MSRGVRYFGLTMGQVGRLAACERKEREVGCDGLTRRQVADVLEVEPTQAGRFIREMVGLGWVYCSWRPERRGRKGQCSTYRTTPVWHEVAGVLRDRGVLPDVCEWPGCEEQALPFRFRGHFWCRVHLQERHCQGCKRRDGEGRCPKETEGMVCDEHGA